MNYMNEFVKVTQHELENYEHSFFNHFRTVFFK